MKVKKEVARDISYASSAKSKAGRAVIRSIENMTGRIRLIKKAKNYENEVARGRDFWEVILEKYKINLNIMGGSFDNIPKKGPLVVVANHPYGILDGLLLGHILSSTRKDFRILAHRIFKKAKDLDDIILPINFDETRDVHHGFGQATILCALHSHAVGVINTARIIPVALIDAKLRNAAN